MAAAIKNTINLVNAFSCKSRHFLSPNYVSKIQVAGLISKNLRDKDYKRPPAYPYQEKKYTLLASLFDRTTYRFDENSNSKLIVVDGPVASGKDKLAKEIADQFDMLYIPHASLDYYYINSYGYDLRMMNEKLPEHVRFFEFENFLANPKDRRRSQFQYDLFCIRFHQYLDAMNHILNTGQGVVMNRCVFANTLFVDTFVKFGFLPKTYRKYNNEVWTCLKPELMRPHLVIYLDTPVDVVLKNLKKRNNPVEINSPVFQPDVLKEMEDAYKFNYLRDISKHAELLVYDNSDGVDTEVVVEDMEGVKLNEEDYWLHDEKMSDWRFDNETDWCAKRIGMSRNREQLESWLFNIPTFVCDELVRDQKDADMLIEAISQVPGNKYAPGYNPDLGDNVIFKN